MKHILLNIAVVSFSAFFSIGALKAQTTILEQNGVSNEFDVSKWTIDAPSFANTNKVNISQSKSGKLIISNTSAYKNIKVELHFSQSQTITFNIEVKGGATSQTKLASSDATGTANKAIVEFNNTSGIQLNQMTISNPSMGMGIVYLKITGVLDGTSSLLHATNNSFEVTVNQESLIINSEIEGTLNVYNNIGQVQGTYALNKGANTVMNATKGVSFLVLTNSNNEMISRKKIMR